jgi:hypothetical protein
MKHQKALNIVNSLTKGTISLPVPFACLFVCLSFRFQFNRPVSTLDNVWLKFHVTFSWIVTVQVHVSFPLTYFWLNYIPWWMARITFQDFSRHTIEIFDWKLISYPVGRRLCKPMPCNTLKYRNRYWKVLPKLSNLWAQDHDFMVQNRRT